VNREDIARIVDDFITIAKVAMPQNLFLEDPRIKKGKALLVSLGRPSSPARPPPNVDADSELEAPVGPIVDWQLSLSVQRGPSRSQLRKAECVVEGRGLLAALLSGRRHDCDDREVPGAFSVVAD
jgi:hypothetical protein